MKTFKDLVFVQDPVIPETKMARMNFDNGYGINVILGYKFYSNWVDTYEAGALFNNSYIPIFQAIKSNKDVLDCATPDEISDLMLKLQRLNISMDFKQYKTTSFLQGISELAEELFLSKEIIK